MSTLSQELDRYLTIRRSLGYDLGTSERVLRRFIAFAEQEDAEHITPGLFLRWQAGFGHADRAHLGGAPGNGPPLCPVAARARSRHEVPPQALIPDRYRRARPYIYSEEEIRRIVAAAAELPSAQRPPRG